MEDIGLPKAVDVMVMMVGEVASPGHEYQELSSYSLPAADMVITEPVADILIVGQDVPVVAESPDHLNTFDPNLLNTFETVGGMPVYCGGDLNDLDCESVGDHDLDTWEDWCDSDFQLGIMDFPRIPNMHSRQLYSVPMCFRVRTWSSRHGSSRNGWQIKDMEAVVMSGGADDIRFLLSACERGTSVGVIAPGMRPILMIGLLDCVGGPLRCSDWLVLLSWWAWLYCRRMSVRGPLSFAPGWSRSSIKGARWPGALHLMLRQ